MMACRTAAVLAWFLARAVLEALFGTLLAWPLRGFAPQREVPQLCFAPTARNRALRAGMGTLLDAFEPAPWAPGPCSQTVFAAYNPPARHPYTRRQIVLAADGVGLLLDWKEGAACPPTSPLLVICPGIGGSADSRVARDLSDRALAAGWRSAVYTRRGHGASSLLPVPVHGRPLPDGGQQQAFPTHCDLGDLEAVARQVAADFPHAPRALVGFSAGSNLVVRYLGERGGGGADRPFMAGVSSCNAHDLVQLADSYAGRPLPNALMARPLQQLLSARLPEVRAVCRGRGIALDAAKLLATGDVAEFEAGVLPLLGGHHRSLQAYHAESSCAASLRRVAVPLLTLAALDDPLIPAALAAHPVAAAAHNSNVFSVTTRAGGHLGWLHGWAGRSWQMECIVRFLEGCFAEGQACRPLLARVVERTAPTPSAT